MMLRLVNVNIIPLEIMQEHHGVQSYFFEVNIIPSTGCCLFYNQSTADVNIIATQLTTKITTLFNHTSLSWACVAMKL